MDRPVLVGRRAELATVRRLVDGAAAGRGGALLVAGEAGIGKTRLLDEVAARAAEHGLPVLSGRAVQGGGTFRAIAGAVIGLLDDPAHAAHPTLRPYRAALSRLLPSWVGPDPAAAGTDPVVVLAEGLLRLFRLALDGATGCVLRLEDLHWADDDTLALVEHLATAAAGSPVLLACSARDDAPTHVARRLAAAPGTVTLRLDRLTEPEVAALAAACRGGRPVAADEVRRLWHRSEGLPYAVEELVDTPGTAVPPTLAALVADRLRALDEPARAVLHAAAVLGPEPDWRLLPATVGAPEDDVLRALRAAVDQALLVADGPRLRWPHALTRDAVVALLLPPERAVLAGRAARVLAARGGPDDEPRAAELFAEAGEPDDAARLLLRLAAADVARGALRSAEQHLAAAAAVGPGTAQADAVAIERVAVLTQVGRAGDALALGTHLLPTLRGDAHAEMCLQLARTAVAGGGWAAAEASVERAGRPDDPRSLVLRADAAFGAGRRGDAGTLAAAAVSRAEATGAHAALCEALGVVSRVAWATDLDVTESAARRAAQIAGEHGLTPWRVRALTDLGMMHMLRTADRSTLWRARDLALDAGMLGQAAAIEFVLNDVLWWIEGPRAAAAAIRPIAETVRPLHLSQLQAGVDAMAEMLDLVARAAAGDPVTVTRRPHPEADSAGIGPHRWRYAQFVVALLEGDLPAGEAALDDGVLALLLDKAVSPPLPLIGAWALLCAVNGRPETGHQARTLPATQVRANRGAFAYADAVVHGRAGRADQAAALLADGDVDLADLPWWHRLLHTVVLRCAVEDGWGDPVPLLRADLAAHEQAGDPTLARTARDLLRRAGARTPRTRAGAGVPTRLRALGVTTREAEVLALVARGMTNVQVAKQLFLSPRTVDTHVANLLAKTGVPSRAELRGFAAESP